MGKSSSKPIVKLQDIKTRVDAREYENIQLHFQTLAMTRDLRSGRILKDDFINNYLKGRLPTLCFPALERFFAVLSFNGKDYIAFDEFLQAKYLLDHIPHEPQILIIKSADELLTPEEVVWEDRLRFVFNLFDMNFSQVINMKDIENMMPMLMQDTSKHDEWSLEDLEDYNQWLRHMSEFAMLQFDMTHTWTQLNWRSFRKLARHDLTIQRIMDLLDKKKPEFGVLQYSKEISREEDQKIDKEKEILKKRKEKALAQKQNENKLSKNQPKLESSSQKNSSDNINNNGNTTDNGELTENQPLRKRVDSLSAEQIPNRPP